VVVVSNYGKSVVPYPPICRLILRCLGPTLSADRDLFLSSEPVFSFSVVITVYSLFKRHHFITVVSVISIRSDL